MRPTGFLITLLILIAPPGAFAQGQSPGDQGQSWQPGQYAPQPAYYGQSQGQGGYQNGQGQFYPATPQQQQGQMMQSPGNSLAARPAAKQAPAKGAMSVNQWFHAYDQIRHQAQMSPSERQRADALMSRGLSVLIPGDEKAATKALLYNMVVRYQKACQDLRALPQLAQTSTLHHAYYNYFATAGQLFSDYVRVQNNLFITDAATGQPLASSLLQRKQMLESFEHQCKQLDAQVRQQYGIAAYPW